MSDENAGRKPWSEAPKWANYIAMDSSGSWYWHQKKPEFNENLGWWMSNGKQHPAGSSPSPLNSLELRK